MNRTALLLASVLPVTPLAASEAVEKAEACDQQQSLCMQQCDGEKVLWLFRGEAYDRCAQACETDLKLCTGVETGDDAFEVIRRRSDVDRDQLAEPVPEPVKEEDEQEAAKEPPPRDN